MIVYFNGQFMPKNEVKVSPDDRGFLFADGAYEVIRAYHHGKLFKIDAVKIAKDAGALITKNIVMLGALAASGALPFKSRLLLETILENVPSKFKDINKKAYEGGFKAFKKS